MISYIFQTFISMFQKLFTYFIFLGNLDFFKKADYLPVILFLVLLLVFVGMFSVLSIKYKNIYINNCDFNPQIILIPFLGPILALFSNKKRSIILSVLLNLVLISFVLLELNIYYLNTFRVVSRCSGFFCSTKNFLVFNLILFLFSSLLIFFYQYEDFKKLNINQKKSLFFPGTIFLFVFTLTMPVFFPLALSFFYIILYFFLLVLCFVLLGFTIYLTKKEVNI